jgi:tetratricopeptide (TPR) repeat protein
LIFGLGKKKKKENDLSVHINGPVTNSPILTGEFHERIIINYSQQLVEKAREFKCPAKPSIFRGESKIFVGRKQHIDTIKSYLVESNLPVSITGEGGIGKTELAYKAMHNSEHIFDLIIPVYFEPLLTFDSFILEMARRLNISLDEFEKKGIEERIDEIINTLGQGEFKHPLIYADNYETIAGVLSSRINSSVTPSSEGGEKDNARKINAFLENLPSNTAILLTSRERYNLDGERSVRLDGLSETEGRDLFIELAKNHFPKGEEPSTEIKKVLEELSKKTGGHPLSIELLARSYRGGGLSKIREMLELLGVGVINPKEETERLRSLGSCFEYSLNMLPQTHKKLLFSLTLFGSPFPTGAVEEVFSFDSSSEILLDVYDLSLLRRIELNEYYDESDHGTETSYHLYYFHPATRNYLEYEAVREGNKQDLEEEYGEKFSLFYYKVIEAAYSAIGTQFHVFFFELFDILIAQGKDNDFERAIRLAKDRSVASGISTYLGLIFEILGIYGKALEFHNKALAINEHLQDRVGMAKDYGNIGNVLHERGNYDQALEYHKKSLAIYEELQDKVGMATAFGNIGIVLDKQGNYDQALEYHKKSLAIDEEFKDKTAIAKDYVNIGTVLGIQGNYDQALEYHKKSLAIYEELQDKVGMATAFENIGIALTGQRNYDQALEYHKKSLAIYEELQDKVGMAKDYRNIGNVLYGQRNYDQALSYYEEGLKVHEELQDKVQMAQDYRNIGLVFDEQRNYDQALEYHKKSLAIHEELQDKVGMSQDHANIGVVLMNVDDRGAIESFSKALEMLQELEEMTAYRHPDINRIQKNISILQSRKRRVGS